MSLGHKFASASRPVEALDQRILEIRSASVPGSMQSAFIGLLSQLERDFQLEIVTGYGVANQNGMPTSDNYARILSIVVTPKRKEDGIRNDEIGVDGFVRRDVQVGKPSA